MRATLLGLTLSAALAGTALAQSSTTIVTDPPPMARPGAPTVIVDPAPDRPPTTGSTAETPPGCASTTTRHEGPDGSATTVRKERCNPQD